MQTKPLLEASKQKHKLARAIIAIFIAIGTFYVAGIDRLDPLLRLFVGAAASAIAAVALFYALSSVRCPKCNLRWVWWSLKHQSHREWLNWLYEFSECPKCKYRAP